MAAGHQCTAACNSASLHEIELLRQQLSLKDALLESKDAVIASRNEVIAELRLNRPLHMDNKKCSDGSSSSSSFADSSVHLQKHARSSLHLAQALEKDEVLDEIFSFVGRKEWLYAGGLCRRWRGRYLSMCYKARASNDEHALQTSHKSSFVTAARFSMALEAGLQMPDEGDAGDFFDDLPQLSQQPIEVLTLARVHGAAWHDHLCRDAAFYGDFELLKWLRASGCPWDAVDVAINAIRSIQGQHQLILPWLLSMVNEWSEEDKDELVFEAGVMQKTKALQLMLDVGAKWPTSFVSEQRVLEETVRASEQLHGHFLKAVVGVSGDVKILHQSCTLSSMITEQMLSVCLSGHIRTAVLAHVRQLQLLSSCCCLSTTVVLLSKLAVAVRNDVLTFAYMHTNEFLTVELSTRVCSAIELLLTLTLLTPHHQAYNLSTSK
jgi:hypothetical protein